MFSVQGIMNNFLPIQLVKWSIQQYNYSIYQQWVGIITNYSCFIRLLSYTKRFCQAMLFSNIKMSQQPLSQNMSQYSINHKISLFLFTWFFGKQICHLIWWWQPLPLLYLTAKQTKQLKLHLININKMTYGQNKKHLWNFRNAWKYFQNF